MKNFIYKIRKKLRSIFYYVTDYLKLVDRKSNINNSNNKIIFLGEYFPARIQRIVKYLKLIREEEFVLYISEWGNEPKLIGPYFDRVVTYRNQFDLKAKISCEANIQLVHAFEPKAQYQYVAFQNVKAPFIYDIQDILITYFYKNPPRKWQRKNLKFEEKLLASNVSFISQSLELNEALRLHEIKRGINTRLFFPLFCDKANFMPLNDKNLGVPCHIVYIGGINNPNEHTSSNFKPFIDAISKTPIKFDIFPSPISEKNCYNEYKQIETEYPNFKINKSVPFNQLNLSSYDFGVVPFDHHFSEKYYSKNKYASTLKFFVYLEMGLPIIISEYWAFPAWIVKRYGLGIVISFENLGSLNEYIQNLDYKTTLENIKNFREKFELSSQIPKLNSFYNTLISSKI